MITITALPNRLTEIGRQIMQESRGEFPDMTPELEEVTDNG